MITELLHNITQMGSKVEFTDDFDGMLTVTYAHEGNYIRHEHISYPGSSTKELEKALIKSLAAYYEELKAGEPKKDGLAK